MDETGIRFRHGHALSTPIMNIAVVTIGSQGDVWPYISLGLGLKQAGHRVRLIAPDDFGATITERGLEFIPLGVNMHKMVQLANSQAGESNGGFFRVFHQVTHDYQLLFEQILDNTWQACQGVQAIIFSAFATHAYYMAQQLSVLGCWTMLYPIFLATRTQPNFAFPFQLPLGSAFNRLTYTAIEQLWQQLTARLLNQWRYKRLGLPPVSLTEWPYRQLNGQPVPVLCGFSTSVFPKPADWDAHVHVTGYWFLDHSPNWQPPTDLLDFINSGPPPICIGYGSKSIGKPAATAELMREALARTQQRAILLKGWGWDSLQSWKGIYLAESIPHDWLFPRVALIVHRGGAGTTAAGLRAGVPSIITPFSFDQSFWGRQVKRLGVGPAPIPLKRLTSEKLADAISTATSDTYMQQRAAALGERIRSEDGVTRAVEVIEHYLGC